MDIYFQLTYENLRELQLKSRSPMQHKALLGQGHFTFFVSIDHTIEVDFTAVIRKYVTRGYDKNHQSPFYGARVGFKDRIQERYNKPSSFTLEGKKDFDTPLKPLVISKENTYFFPEKKISVWLIGEDFIRNELNKKIYFIKTNQVPRYTSTLLQFTLVRLSHFFNDDPGEYVHLTLDPYMIYPDHKTVTYSDEPRFINDIEG